MIVLIVMTALITMMIIVVSDTIYTIIVTSSLTLISRPSYQWYLLYIYLLGVIGINETHRNNDKYISLRVLID